MQIKSLHLYPIKGLAGISVQQATTQAEGFKFDRRWLLVDEQGTFLSQRNHPKLALFSQEIDATHLRIRYNGQELAIPLDEETGDPFTVKVFEMSMLAREVSPAISQWFSERLESPIRLVRHSQVTQRIKSLVKGPETTPLSFADGYPYLILGTASLNALNEKLSQAIPMNRFRPNIVVETKVPHIEDSWEKIQIGEQQFMVIKPCARCEVTTIDQATAQRGKEPLKTLAKYRREKNKVNFGANTISLGAGRVNVGDEIKLLEK